MKNAYLSRLNYRGYIDHVRARVERGIAVLSGSADRLRAFPEREHTSGRIPRDIEPLRSIRSKSTFHRTRVRSSMDGGKNPIRDGDYLLLELISPSSAGSNTGALLSFRIRMCPVMINICLGTYRRMREATYCVLTIQAIPTSGRMLNFGPLPGLRPS